MRPSIYVIYAGGTIGMRQGAGGLGPAPGLLPELMRAMPELQGSDVPQFTIHEFARLLDSSNMTPEDWNAIGRAIAEQYATYDGFVVLHGTDTMAYTASALSFMLEGLGKPIVFTGSQIPLCETRNDARSNLLNALLIAGIAEVPEVTLCFGRQLMRGNRAVKLHVDGLDAFATPAYPPLGDLGIEIEIHRDRVRAPDPVPFRLRPCRSGLVAALRLFPGITSEVLASVLRPPLRGLVLEAYGSGNAPTADPEFLGALAEATARGVVIVVVTQCLYGAVDIGAYATGSALAGAGVVGGHDMTIEAAVCKLLYLLGQSEDPAWIRTEMGRDLRGELTPAINERGRAP
jgi:L-asparaginase